MTAVVWLPATADRLLGGFVIVGRHENDIVAGGNRREGRHAVGVGNARGDHRGGVQGIEQFDASPRPGWDARQNTASGRLVTVT